MPPRMSAEEAELGCSPKSKLYPIAGEIRSRYLAGESFRQLAIAFAAQGVTESMVSGFVSRNKLKRSADQIVQAAEIQGPRRALMKAALERHRAKVREGLVPKATRKARRAPEKPQEAPPTLKLVSDTPGVPQGSRTLLRMRGCMCWFPVGSSPIEGADQLFCASVTLPGETFCMTHKKLAYDPPKGRIRVRARG